MTTFFPNVCPGWVGVRPWSPVWPGLALGRVGCQGGGGFETHLEGEEPSHHDAVGKLQVTCVGHGGLGGGLSMAWRGVASPQRPPPAPSKRGPAAIAGTTRREATRVRPAGSRRRCASAASRLTARLGSPPRRKQGQGQAGPRVHFRKPSSQRCTFKLTRHARPRPPSTLRGDTPRRVSRFNRIGGRASHSQMTVFTRTEADLSSSFELTVSAKSLVTTRPRDPPRWRRRPSSRPSPPRPAGA